MWRLVSLAYRFLLIARHIARSTVLSQHLLRMQRLFSSDRRLVLHEHPVVFEGFGCEHRREVRSARRDVTADHREPARAEDDSATSHDADAAADEPHEVQACVADADRR